MVRLTRGILLAGILAWSGIIPVSAQHPVGTFGPTLLRPFPFPVRELLSVYTSKDAVEHVLVSSRAGRQLYDIRFPSGTTAQVVDSIRIPYPYRILHVETFGGRSRSSLIVLRTDSLAIQDLARDGTGAWRMGKPVRIDRTPVAVYGDDLNGDGIEDLLLVDDQEPGILPLYGRQNGQWRMGRVIVPDLPIGRVATLHLNNDGLLDMLAYDWVRSEIHLIYGVGKERFLDQGDFSVDMSVDRIFIDPVTERHPLRVTLFDKGRSALMYLEMDDRGDLVEVSRQVIADTVRTIYTVHDDSTFRSLFILTADSSVSLIRDAFLARTPTLTTIGLAGKATSSWVGEDTSLAMVLNSTVYCRIWTFDAEWPRTDSLILAMPARPIAVTVRDHNGDGHDDLTVISGRTGVISFVWGSSDGRFRGVEEFAGPSSPRTAIGQSFDAPMARFYMTHERPSSVSVTEIEWRDMTVTTSRIPVSGSTELIDEMRAPSGTTSLSAIHRVSDRTVTFSTYERIQQDSFLEQTLNLGPPAVLFGASVGYVDDDSIPDAILIYRPDDSSSVALNVAYGDTSTQIRRQPVSRVLPVKDPRRTYLWQTDADNDSLPDIVAVFPRTAREIYLMMSTSDSLYAKTLRVDSAVAIEQRQHVAVLDVDNDSLPDICAIIRDRGGMGWWRNTGHGTYASWELLAAADDISGFAFGRFFQDDGYDLVVARRSMNAVIIYAKDRLPWGRR